MSSSSRSPFLERCRVGVEYGVLGAVAYSLFVVVAYVVTGGSNLEDQGLTLPGVLSAYFAGGIGGGLIYGVLGPLAKWRMGAAVVGFFVSIPIWVGAAIILPALHLGDAVTWVTILLAAVLVGGIGGFILWEADR